MFKQAITAVALAAGLIVGAPTQADAAGCRWGQIPAGSSAVSWKKSEAWCFDPGSFQLELKQNPTSWQRLVFQPDGNLVMYSYRTETGKKARWSSGTHGNPGARLAFQSDGNVVIYSAAGRALWQSGTSRDSDVGRIMLRRDWFSPNWANCPYPNDYIWADIAVHGPATIGDRLHNTYWSTGTFCAVQ